MHRALQAVIHGMVFAFVYLVLQKRQVLCEGKGEALFPPRVSNLLLFLSVISFVVRHFNTPVHFVLSAAYEIPFCGHREQWALQVSTP